MRNSVSRVLSGFAALAVGGVFVAASAIGALADSPAPSTVNTTVSGQSVTVSGSLFWGSGCSTSKVAKAGYGVVWNDTGDKGLAAPGDASQLVGLTGSPGGESDQNLVHTNTACSGSSMVFGPLTHTYQNWPPSPARVCVIAYDYRPGQTSPAFHSIYEANAAGQLGNTDNSILETPSGGVPIVCKDIVAPPTLSLTKSASPPSGSNVARGQQIDYSLHYSNTSSTAATGVTITDAIPAGTTYKTGSAALTTAGTAGFANNTVTYTLNIPGNSSGNATFSVTVNANASNGQVIDNVGLISFGGSTTPSNHTQHTVVVPPANLTLSKSANPASGTNVVRGQQIDYTLHYANTGGTDAAGVTITDVVPAGTTFKTGSASCTTTCTPSYSFATNTVSYALNIPANTSGDAMFSVTVNTNAPAGQVIDNVGQLTFDNIPPVTSNHTRHTVVVPPPQAPDVTISNVATPSSVNAGDLVTYHVVVSNLAGATKTTAQTQLLVDTLDPNVQFVSVTAGAGWGNSCQYASGTHTVSCSYAPALAPGAATSEVTIVGRTATTAPPTVVNTAHVDNGIGNPDDANPNNQTATVSTPVVGPPPSITVDKTATPSVNVGQPITYTVTVTNRSASPTNSTITVTDALPQGVQYSSASGTNWSCTGSQSLTCTWLGGALSANGGTTAPLTIVGTATNAAVPSVINTAVAHMGNITVQDSATTTVNTPVDLTLSKSADPASGSTVSRGQQIDYTLHYANTGTTDAHGVVITDAIPNGTSYVPGSASCTTSCTTSVSGNTVAFTLDVAAGTSGTAMFSVTVDSDAANGLIIDNVAHITFNGNDTPSNHTQHQVFVQTGDLALSKAVTPTKATVGTVLTYTLTATATGNTNQSNVVVTDAVPDGSTYQAGSATCEGPNACTASYDATTNEITWNLGTLSPGDTASMTFDVKVDGPAADGTLPTAIANVGDIASDQTPQRLSNRVVVPVTFVLGEKVVKTPTTPTTLPFTGFDVLQNALLALVCVGAGLVLLTWPRLQQIRRTR